MRLDSSSLESLSQRAVKELAKVMANKQVSFVASTLQTKSNEGVPLWVIKTNERILGAADTWTDTSKSPKWSEGAFSGAMYASFKFFVTASHLPFAPSDVAPVDYKKLYSYIKKMAQIDVATALEWNNTEAIDFLAGFLRGMESVLQPSGFPGKAHPKYTLDLMLLFRWQEVIKRKSVTELYNYFLAQGGDFWISTAGDLEAFQKYCNRIGLRLGGRGRRKSDKSKSTVS